MNNTAGRISAGSIGGQGSSDGSISPANATYTTAGSPCPNASTTAAVPPCASTQARASAMASALSSGAHRASAAQAEAVAPRSPTVAVGCER